MLVTVAAPRTPRPPFSLAALNPRGAGGGARRGAAGSAMRPRGGSGPGPVWAQRVRQLERSLRVRGGASGWAGLRVEWAGSPVRWAGLRASGRGLGWGGRGRCYSG